MGSQDESGIDAALRQGAEVVAYADGQPVPLPVYRLEIADAAPRHLVLRLSLDLLSRDRAAAAGSSGKAGVSCT